MTKRIEDIGQPMPCGLGTKNPRMNEGFKLFYEFGQLAANTNYMDRGDIMDILKILDKQFTHIENIRAKQWKQRLKLWEEKV